MSEIKPWREYIGKHDAYMIMCDVLDVLCEKEAIKKTVYERLKQAPSADRPRGKWVYHKDNMPCVRWDRWECDQCHNRTEYISDYCPNCGADMRGADDES